MNAVASSSPLELLRRWLRQPLLDLVELAVDAIANHSVIPLKLASLMGFCITVASLLGFFYEFLFSSGSFLLRDVWICDLLRPTRCQILHFYENADLKNLNFTLKLLFG